MPITSKRTFMKYTTRAHDILHPIANGAASVGLTFSHATSAYVDKASYTSGGVGIILFCINWATDYTEIIKNPKKFTNNMIADYITHVKKQSNAYNGSQIPKDMTNEDKESNKEKRNLLLDNLLKIHSDNESPETIKYIRSRIAKMGGKKVINIGMTPATSHMAGINPYSLILNLSATATSLGHINKIREIKKRIGDGGEKISRIVDDIIAIKEVKSMKKALSLAFSCVPGSDVIHSARPIISLLTPIIDEMVSPAIKQGKKVKHKLRENKETSVRVTSIDLNNTLEDKCKYLHFLAFKYLFVREYFYYKETDKAALSKRTIKNYGRLGICLRFEDIGSTSEQAAYLLFCEIFKKRGVTSLFGAYDTKSLILEPMGWKALLDKLVI